MSDELMTNAEVERRVQEYLNSDAFKKRCQTIVDAQLDVILRKTPAAIDGISAVGTLSKREGDGRSGQGGVRLVARDSQQQDALRRAQSGDSEVAGVPSEFAHLTKIEHIET